MATDGTQRHRITLAGHRHNQRRSESLTQTANPLLHGVIRRHRFQITNLIHQMGLAYRAPSCGNQHTEHPAQGRRQGQLLTFALDRLVNQIETHRAIRAQA